MNTRRQNIRGKRPGGFTFFELTLVLLILGIVAAALVPAINSNIASPKLRTAANVLAADIEFCASECIAQPSSPRAISFDTVNNQYSVLDFNAGTVIANPGDAQPFINDFATGRNAQLNGVTITSIAMGGGGLTTLMFDAYGRPLITSNCVITLSYNGQTLTVTVNMTTGDVSITG